MRLIQLAAPHNLASVVEVLAQYPDTIFPSEASRINFAELGYAVVVETVAPQPDSQHRVEDAGVQLVDGHWTQTFRRVPLTTDELQARQDAEAQALEEARTAYAAEVDARVAAVYSRWMRFESEYVQRETAARAHAAGGYNGDPGPWVTSFALPAGLPYRAAADRIIAQANQLRKALQDLAALRMAKYHIKASNTLTEVTSVYEDIVNQINAIEETL